MQVRFTKNILTAAACVVMAFSLSACSSDADTSKLSQSSIEIKKDGRVVSTLIDDFAEDYYSADELKTMAEEEIASFNASNGAGAAELVSVEADNGKVKLVTNFNTASDYAHYNGESLIYETVQEAIAGGQLSTNDLVDTEGNKVPSDKAGALDKEHVVITSAKLALAVPYKIKYMSGNYNLISGRIADLSGNEAGNTVCIVLSK